MRELIDHFILFILFFLCSLYFVTENSRNGDVKIKKEKQKDDLGMW